MSLINLDLITEGKNARTVTVSAAAEVGLRRSIAAMGVLSPVLLRPLRTEGDDAPIPINQRSELLEIVLGHRRVRAARAAGLAEIPAEVRDLTDAEVDQMQLAENIQREHMHPVDQWRGVSALVMDGMTIEAASSALGLDERQTRQMEQLGRLRPMLLSLCEIQMPRPGELRVIAAAPVKLQDQLADTKSLALKRHDGTDFVPWDEIANRCQIKRIPRGIAIFDPDTTGIQWDEDLFAEPGADDQFTTPDVDAFLEAQHAALTADVERRNAGKKQRRHQIAEMKKNAWSVDLPKGFQIVYGADVEKLKRDEIGLHAVAPDGAVHRAVAIGTAAKSDAQRADDDGTIDDEDDDSPVPEPAVKAPFTKEGSRILAEMKTTAVREALDQTPMEPADVLALLVLALTATNVTIATAGFERFGDLAARILLPGGKLAPMSDADITAIGQTAIGRILAFDYPDACTGITSGSTAEWIGAAIDAGQALGRFDTPEFLATLSAAELKRAAVDVGMKATSSAAELRKLLAGRAKDYRPDQAVFGAPAPKGDF